MGKVDPSVNKSTVFAVPAVIGLRSDKSRALRVGRNQIAQANEVAKSMGCGEPFGSDGHPTFTTPEKRKYMKELNKRRADHGQERLVNFDGGYGDET